MIENALHAMPRGGALEVSGRLSPDGRAVRLQIRDSGVGMDRADLARIFEPYFSTKAVGTGLGLTIAKRNVELHGGTITVDSAPGRGTMVSVEIRRAGPRRRRRRQAEAAAPRAAGTVPRPRRSAPPACRSMQARAARCSGGSR